MANLCAADEPTLTKISKRFLRHSLNLFLRILTVERAVAIYQYNFVTQFVN